VFAALMRRWRRLDAAARVEETVFLDVGAGMGRAMLLAAEMNFKEVVGLELNRHWCALRGAILLDGARQAEWRQRRFALLKETRLSFLYRMRLLLPSSLIPLTGQC